MNSSSTTSSNSSASNSPAKSSPRSVTFADQNTVFTLPTKHDEIWQYHFSTFPTQVECLRARNIMHQFYDFLTEHSARDARELKKVDLKPYYDLIFRLIIAPTNTLAAIHNLFAKTKIVPDALTDFITQLKLCMFGQAEFRDYILKKSEREINVFAFSNFCSDFQINVKKICFDKAASTQLQKNYEDIATHQKLEAYILESAAFCTDEKRSFIRDLLVDKIRTTSSITDISRTIDEIEATRYKKIRAPEVQKSFLESIHADYYKGQQVSFQFMQIILAAKNQMTTLIRKKINACQDVNAVKKLIDDLESNSVYTLIRERNGYTTHSFWGYQYNNQPVSQIFSDILKVAKDRMLVVAEMAANSGNKSELVALSNPSSPHHQFLSSPRTRFAKPVTTSLEQLGDLQLDNGLTMKAFK